MQLYVVYKKFTSNMMTEVGSKKKDGKNSISKPRHSLIGVFYQTSKELITDFF